MPARTSKLGTLDIKLADWVEPRSRYSRRLIPVDPQSEVESGDAPGLNARPEFRTFRTRSWRGGEGVTWWERDRAMYRQSTNVRPVSIRDGLELGARQQVTQRAAVAFNDGQRFGYGLGKLWTIVDNTMYPWDASVPDWDTGTATGAVGSDATSITDGSDATNMYIGLASGAIRKVADGGANSQLLAAGTFTFAPVLRSFNGVLYALDGDDLYTINQTTGARTQVGDPPGGSSSVFLASTPWSYGRMSLSDRGPIWVRRLNNGQTLLELYNPFLDQQETLGKLSVDFAFPYSVLYTHGFSFVGLRYAPAHSESGLAYLWFKRGATEGYAGPFRAPSGVTASKPVLLAGTVGDDLIVYFDGAVWAYNLTDGGISQTATATTTGTPQEATTRGRDVFVAPTTSGADTQSVERFVTDEYTTQSATIDLGKIDFDYPGLAKILLDITVVTDPLPANTTIQTAVSVDGGSFTNIGAASSTDNQTKHKWTVSTNASTVTGVEFELRLLLASTSTSASPTVREVSARATGADHVLEVVMELDVSQDIGRQGRQTLISGLNTLGEAGDVVSFTDNFQVEEGATGTAYDVTVEEVITPEVQDEQTERVSATVRVLAVSLQND